MIEICFEHVFIDTTDPNTPYSRLLQLDVLSSIVFHIILYLAVLYVFGFVFNIKFSNQVYIRLTFVLLVIMILGYIGRLTRSKYLRDVFIEKGESKEDADIITKNMIRTAYYTHYFLG